jgi:hypothetical protein
MRTITAHPRLSNPVPCLDRFHKAVNPLRGGGCLVRRWGALHPQTDLPLGTGDNASRVGDRCVPAATALGSLSFDSCGGRVQLWPESERRSGQRVRGQDGAAACAEASRGRHALALHVSRSATIPQTGCRRGSPQIQDIGYSGEVVRAVCRSSAGSFFVALALSRAHGVVRPWATCRIEVPPQRDEGRSSVSSSPLAWCAYSGCPHGVEPQIPQLSIRANPGHSGGQSPDKQNEPARRGFWPFVSFVSFVVYPSALWSAGAACRATPIHADGKRRADGGIPRGSRETCRFPDST